MPTAPHFPDDARFFRSPALPGAELLTARYYRHSFAPHWHEGYVVAVITAGAEGYRYRGARQVAGPSMLACINPGEIHTGERAADEGWAYRVFYPDAAVLQGVARELQGREAGPPRLPHHAVQDPELARALVRAHLLLEQGQDLLQAQTAALDALSALVARHGGAAPDAHRRDARPGAPGGPRATPCSEPRVDAMRQRLAADLCEALTLDDLAACVGLSAFHAARLFARHTGLPPHAWRNQLRLNRSLDFLRRGLSVAEAAQACGFADQSHYTRHFRRSFGAAPGRWRG